MILTFEYIGAILLMVDMGAEDEALVGYVFAALHVAFILHSVRCFVEIVREVRRAGLDKPEEEAQQSVDTPRGSTVVVPDPGSALASGGTDAHVYAALKMRQMVQAKLDRQRGWTAAAGGGNRSRTFTDGRHSASRRWPTSRHAVKRRETVQAA